jgi:Domain of unknown function (DUF4279)
MPVLQRAVATLRIVGDELEPEEVTRLLGCQPTDAARRGEARIGKHTRGPTIARTGVWRLEATPTEPEDLGAQVLELTSKLTSDLGIWTDLARKYKIDLFCGWFMKESNEGVDITARTLETLSSRHIALALDIYAPDGDA